MTRQSSVEGGDVHIFSGPISTSNAGEEDVKREPDRQIEDDADDWTTSRCATGSLPNEVGVRWIARNATKKPVTAPCMLAHRRQLLAGAATARGSRPYCDGGRCQHITAGVRPQSLFLMQAGAIRMKRPAAARQTLHSLHFLGSAGGIARFRLARAGIGQAFVRFRTPGQDD
jgi:hypothetical protein